MSDGKKRDPLMEWGIIAGALIAAYFIIGHAFGPQIAEGWFFWQKVKINAVDLLFSSDHVKELVAALSKNRNWANVSIEQSYIAGDEVSSYWRWVTLPFIGIWAYLIASKNPINKLKNKHSMKTLIESESRVWPHVQPVLKLNLIDEPVDKGIWASAQNPIEFAKENKLLLEGTELDKERATKVFTSQLNKVWSGAKNLDPLSKAFFAIFAAHGNWDAKDPVYKSGRNDARMGINKLAASFYLNPKKLDTSWADELLEKHAAHPAVIEITTRHAYTHTVMMSLLEYGRKNGVLPSSEFFWLRSVDRQLWYTLNNVGRNVAWTEVAGIYGHWLAEKINEGPLLRPYVQKTVEAMADALKNIKLKPGVK